MSVTSFPYATLILPDQNGIAVAPYLDVIQDIFETLDNAHTPIRERSRVIGSHYVVSLRVDPDGAYGPSISLRITDIEGMPADDDTAVTLLTLCTLQTLAVSPADIVEWCDQGTLIDRDDFIRQHQDKSPEGLAKNLRIKGELGDLRTLLAQEPEETEEPESPAGILTRDSDRDPAKSRLGAAGWLMTAALAAISLPAAIALGIYGLLRGMEFRLATQVVSVTVLFVALANTDGLNQIVHAIIR